MTDTIVYNGIDILKRFPRTTLAEARAKAAESEKWVFPEFICSAVTTIYGRSNVGKSYLVSSLILSLMVEDREFLGMQPTDPNKEWRPVILCTDPGSDAEYGERISTGMPEGVELEVPSHSIGMTKRADEWEALTDYLVDEGHNLVVLDNLMGATGDTNDPAVCSTVFDGLNRLVSRGVPVVVLHHESEHGGPPKRGAPPMGASVIVQKSRVWIQARQTERKKLRGGNLGLYVQSNKFDQPHEVIAEPKVGPNYTVLKRHLVDDEGKPVKRDRSGETLDRNAEMARWVADHCQGRSQNQTAKALAAEFGGSENSYRPWLSPTGKLGVLLRRLDGDRWALADVLDAA